MDEIDLWEVGMDPDEGCEGIVSFLSRAVVLLLPYLVLGIYVRVVGGYSTSTWPVPECTIPNRMCRARFTRQTP